MGWGLSLNGKEKESFPPAFIHPCLMATDTSPSASTFVAMSPHHGGTAHSNQEPSKSFLP